MAFRDVMKHFSLQKHDSDVPLGTSDNPSCQIFTVSNGITVSRLVLALLFFILFVGDISRKLALIIYAVAASTDWLDGYLARRTQTVSWFGKILDPLVDRALLSCGVVGLTLRGELPLWIALFVIGRDVYLLGGGCIVRRYQRRPVDVLVIGKVTTAFLMAGFCLMLLGYPILGGFGLTSLEWLPVINAHSGCLGLLFIYIGCALSVITALLYTLVGARLIQAARSKHGKDSVSHEMS